MALQNVPPVPYTTPMVDDKSLPNNQWAIWFRQLAQASSIFYIVGTRSNPTTVTNEGIQLPTNDTRILMRVVGNGPTTISSNPYIAAGSFDGQELLLEGCSDTATLSIHDGNGVELASGASVTLGLGDKISFTWNLGASLWTENWRITI